MKALLSPPCWLFVFVILSFQSRSAEITVTIQYDMSGVSEYTGTPVRTFHNMTSEATGNNNYEWANLIDIGNGIWSIDITYDDAIVIFEGARAWFNNGANVNEDAIPSSCGTFGGQNFRSIYPFSPSDGDVLRFAFNGCRVNVYENGVWSNPLADYDLLKVEENYTISEGIIASNVNIALGKTVTVASGGNLDIRGSLNLQEPGFSDILLGTGNADVASDWFISDGSGFPSLSINTTEQVEGTGCFEINFPDNTSAYRIFRNGLNLASGTNYEFSFWAKGDISNPANSFDIFVFTRASEDDVAADFESATLTDAWTKYTYSYTPPTTEEFTMQFSWNSNNSDPQDGSNAGTYYIDDIQILETSTGTVGALEVASGGTLITYAADANTAPVTVKRSTRYSDGKYSFVGSPVKYDADIKGSELGSTVYYYDETQNYNAVGGPRWQDASGLPLVEGKGYAQAFQKNLIFKGVPNDGDITVSDLTYSAGSTDEQGWNLISNPYPAAIDFELFTSGNPDIEGSIYLWDDGGSETGVADNDDYLTVSSAGSVGGPNGGDFNGYIGAMQGFFVKVKEEGTVSVTFTEGMRDDSGITNGDANFFRKAEDKQENNVKLSVESKTSGIYNELLVSLREDATLGIDRIYDATKLIGNEYLQFYSLINDGKYAIQGLPIKDGISTELAFNLGKDSDLTLSVVEMTGLESGMSFFLKDNITGIVYDLTEVNSFDFSATKGTDQNRFTLTYGSAIVLATTSTNQPLYKYRDGELSVDFIQPLDVLEYAVYDLAGSTLVKSNKMKSNVEHLEMAVLVKGINIVKIATSEGVFTRKFVF